MKIERSVRMHRVIRVAAWDLRVGDVLWNPSGDEFGDQAYTLDERKPYSDGTIYLRWGDEESDSAYFDPHESFQLDLTETVVRGKL